MANPYLTITSVSPKNVHPGDNITVVFNYNAYYDNEYENLVFIDAHLRIDGDSIESKTLFTSSDLIIDKTGSSSFNVNLPERIDPANGIEIKVTITGIIQAGSWNEYIASDTDSVNVYDYSNARPTVITRMTNETNGVRIYYRPYSDGIVHYNSYEFFRKIDNGEYQSIYRISRNGDGVETSYIDRNIPQNSKTVQYRIDVDCHEYITQGTPSDIMQLNVAPSTPPSITVPSTLKENVAATISWGASTDSDGNLSGYILEQQLNGGSWTQVYKGSARSKSITPQASWNKVAYRVKAYDSQNAMSSYKTSATVTVQHNSAPSMPEWCSVPNPVKGGTSIKITWPASTDPDGNLSGYILERKFNSNSWTQIYKGANRSYTDPIPLDKYKTVTYRVKAYDTKNAQSAYATSATRTIQNSTVLQFRLKTPIESPNRARYGQEIMTYTIPSGATFKAEACNNGFDENPTWEDVTEFVKKQKIFEFANKTKTASKWGYDIRVTVDRNGATGNCYFTRGNGFFEEEE